MSQGFGWLVAGLLVGGGVAVAYWWPSQSPAPGPTPETAAATRDEDGTDDKGQPKKTDFATGD